MMISKKIIILFSFILMLSVDISATGPSYISSEMKPISVNNKGEILCRTRFYSNSSGGSCMPTIGYGLCVLTNDTILQINTRAVGVDCNADLDEMKQFEAEGLYCDSIYNSVFNLKRLSAVETKFIKGYNFNQSNVKRYKKDKKVTFKSLKSRYSSSDDLHLVALHGARGSCENEDQYINILYDFGHTLILENKESTLCEGEEYNIGAYFDYPVGFGYERVNDDGVGVTVDCGYDCQTVTGVLFLK